jgi:hypothetical protein
MFYDRRIPYDKYSVQITGGALMMTILNLFFGILFGFILSRVGATQYDLIANMFLL